MDGLFTLLGLLNREMNRSTGESAVQKGVFRRMNRKTNRSAGESAVQKGVFQPDEPQNEPQRG
jgi:hypothetical protein